MRFCTKHHVGVDRLAEALVGGGKNVIEGKKGRKMGGPGGKIISSANSNSKPPPVMIERARKSRLSGKKAKAPNGRGEKANQANGTDYYLGVRGLKRGVAQYSGIPTRFSEPCTGIPFLPLFIRTAFSSAMVVVRSPRWLPIGSPGSHCHNMETKGK